MLRLLLTVKHGRMGMEWNAYRDCLCMKEGNCVEVSVSPRVVRGVLVYKDQVVIGCSRSIVQYRMRVRNGELEVNGVSEESVLVGELIGMRVYGEALYVLLNEGGVNVLLRWNGVDWKKVSEVSSEMRLFVLVDVGNELLYGFAGREWLLKRGDECVYRWKLGSVCLCVESVGEEVWLGSGNGELFCWNSEGMKCVYKLRSGIMRVSVCENEVLLCGSDGVLMLLRRVGEECVMEWMNGRMSVVDVCMCDASVLVMKENEVCCLSVDGKCSEVIMRNEGLKCMVKSEELLLCGTMDGVLLKSVNGRRLKQVSFWIVC